MKLNKYINQVIYPMTLMLMILIMILNGCQTDLENGVYPNDSDPMIEEFL